ncbi:unnamed protein product [Sphagnum jensenii]|uniref:Nuclear pore complex protein n=1 Tax=Sphagnum jensenii TaxID=128206 RepID=A0ABP1ACN5_9BRYO
MEAGNNHGKEKRLSDDTRMKISDLEGWMKHRTFRREEADRLIEILRSSVVDNGVDTKKAAAANLEVKSSTPNMLHGTRLQANEAQPSNSLQSDEQRLREELRKNWQEQKLNFWPHGFGKENGTPPARVTEDVEALDASPIDLARAYMDERVPRVHSRERNVIPQRFSPYQQRSPSSRWLRKDLRHDNSQLQHRATSPYQLAQPPVARPTSLAIRGIQESMLEDKVFFPPVCQALDYLPPVHHFTHAGSALDMPHTEGSKKRRATALDGADYSSGGPMRRLRQRSSLYTPSPARGVQKQPGLDQFPPPPARTLQMTTMEAKQNQSTVRSGKGVMSEARKNGPELKNKRDEERRGSVGPLGGLSFVPAQSSETARKILETLERMTPSPRGKSLEEELALVREQPPTVLTSSMLNDKASLTMQTWKFPDLHEIEDAGPSDSKVEKDLLSVEEFGWRGTDHSTKLEGNGKAPLFGSTEVSYENATDRTPDASDTIEGSTKETQESWKEPEPDLAGVGAITGKSKGFRMSAAFDESGSDDESQVVSTTSTVFPVNPISQFISSGSIHTKPLPTITSPVVGSPASLETETHATLWNPISSQAGSPGDFTFPSTTPPGAFLEPPSTPKPFPSATMNDGGQPFKHLSNPTVGKLGALGATEDTDPSKRKLDFKFDSKPEFIFSAAAAAASGTPQSPATQDSPLESCKSAEIMTKSDFSSTTGVLTSNSLFPHTSLETKTSLVSTPSFSSAGAGSEAGNSTSTSLINFAAHTPTSEQHTTSSPHDKPELDENLPVTTHSNTSIFGFSSTASTSVPPAQPTADKGTSGSISGTTGLASSAAPSSPFTFGSSSAFELSKSPFPFGAISVPPSHTSSPPTNSTDAGDSQERVDGQDAKKSRSSGNMSGALSTDLGFGLTVTSSTSTVVPAEGLLGGSSAASTPSQGLFSIPAFGQGMSSSTPALPGGSAASPPSLFGLSPATTALSAPTPTTTMTPSPFAFGSSAPTGFGAITGSASSFGTMTTSVFGSSTLPTLTGALSTPAFGVKSSNNQMFGSFSNDVKAQPSPVAPLFGSGFGAPVNLNPTPPSSTFSFEAPSTSSTASPFAFGSSAAAPSSAFSFGATSGSSPPNPFSFGAKPELSSPPVFRSANFGAPLFGSSPNTAMASDASAENHMEDSMAEEPPPSQMASGVAPPQQTPPLFGAPTGSGSFLFGQQSSAPAGATTPVFSFGAQPSPAVENTFAPAVTAVNPFAPALQQPNSGGLNFSGSPFALGSSGQDTSSRTNRKFIKAKRTGTTKRR